VNGQCQPVAESETLETAATQARLGLVKKNATTVISVT